MRPIADMIGECRVKCVFADAPFTACVDDNNSTDYPSKRVKKDCCNWIGFYKNLDTHLKYDCAWAPAKCSHEGCTQVNIVKASLREHEEKCPYRLEKCKYCKVDVRLIEMEEHFLVCDEAPVVCECGYKTDRWLLENHRARVCNVTEIECIYAKYGCSLTLRRPDLEEHYRDDSHEHLELMERVLHAKDVQQAREISRLNARQIYRRLVWRVRWTAITFNEVFYSESVELLLPGQTEPCELKIGASFVNHILWFHVSIAGEFKEVDIEGTTFTLVSHSHNIEDIVEKIPCDSKIDDGHYCSLPIAPREFVKGLASGSPPDRELHIVCHFQATYDETV